MTEFDKQDLFRDRMIGDYTKGVYPQLFLFSDYFGWKMGKLPLKCLTRSHAHKMIDAATEMLGVYYQKCHNITDDISECASDDVWAMYRGYGEDMYIVSYLEAIDAEITNLLVMGVIK